MPIQTNRAYAFLLACLMAPLLFGCLADMMKIARPLLPAKDPLPEHIYQQPPKNYFPNARVGVFRFAEPADHANVGRAAAESLYNQLADKNIFSEVQPLMAGEGLSVEDELDIAGRKNLDLIITGRVLYYLDGTAFQDSRVDEEFTVYNVKTREIVWQAMAVEVGRPHPEQDYYVYRTEGHMPPPPAALLNRNAAKFINLLQGVSSSQAGVSADDETGR